MTPHSDDSRRSAAILGRSVVVDGTPAPQGSMKAFIRGGRPIVTSDNKNTRPWRERVRAEVRSTVGPGIVYPRPTAVLINAEFVMPRRKAEPKRVTPPHTRKPDTDKLARAVGDALTGVVYEDDSQVVEWHIAKRTAEIGEAPHAFIGWETA